MKRLFIILFIFLWASVGWAAGTAHYVWCGGSGTDSGTAANPWLSLASLAAAGPQAESDDIYFKMNVTCTLNDNNNRVNIDWHGTENDRVIIGCYNSVAGDCNPTPYVDDGKRAVFDGTRVSGAAFGADPDGGHPGQYQSLIGSDGYNYITIQDIKLVNSGGYGITIANGDYGIIANCITSNSTRYGIGMARTEYGTIYNNDVSDGYDYKGTGDCIDVTATGLDNSSRYNTVKENRVYDCNEGIGVYQKATYNTVEHNVVFNVGTGPGIYSGAGKYNHIRYNLVYHLDSSGRSAGPGIFLDNETMRNYCFSGDNYIYGNIVTHAAEGIKISNQCGSNDGAEPYPLCDTDCNNEGILVYNNTLADNGTNILISRDDAGWTGNKIKNNISWQSWSGDEHVNNPSPEGFTWSHNIFYSTSTDDGYTYNGPAVPVGGTDARDGAGTGDTLITDPKLTEGNDWYFHNLVANTVTGQELKTLVGGAGVNTGVAINDYNYRMTDTTDFTANPIVVSTTEDGAYPDIGAWVYGEGGPSDPVYPLQGVAGSFKLN